MSAENNRPAGFVQRDPRPETDLAHKRHLTPTSTRYVLSDEQAHADAYWGYPEVAQDIIDSAQAEMVRDYNENAGPVDTSDTALHLRSDGTPKFLHEAKSPEERQAIISHTQYRHASAGLGEASVAATIDETGLKA